MSEQTPPRPSDQPPAHWTDRHGKPIIFVILTLVAVGIYVAFSIPVSVFPETDFPRIVIGADNGVAPIDQMLVTVTRPIEEAMNSVQGRERVKSITSRGTAEVNLFFDWGVDMYRTLELVNAALARVQPSLPPTTKLVANRLTFAAFPILGASTALAASLPSSFRAARSPSTKSAPIPPNCSSPALPCLPSSMP